MAFKLKVSAIGVYYTGTVNFPVYGGPYYYNKAEEYSYEWDGKTFVVTDKKQLRS